MTTATGFDELAEKYERFCALWEGIDASVHGWVAAALDKTLDPGMSERESLDDPWTPVHEVHQQPVRHGMARGLDIGCGTGRSTVQLKQRCLSVIGIDPSGSMLEIARKLRGLEGIRYQRQTMDDHTAPFGPYHYVLSVRALHHAGDADTVLPKVRQLLAPGGRLVVVDMVNPGGWETHQFHLERAERMAAYAIQTTGDSSTYYTTKDLLLHPTWLDSVVADVPLHSAQFHDTYQRHFPGVVTYHLDEMTRGVVWDAPTDKPPNRPPLDARGNVAVSTVASL